MRTQSSSPVVLRVLRGERVESVHRADLAVVDEEGHLLASCGDPERKIFIRSAAKPFQALPLLEAGGARTFRLGSEEIALMCASHGGEPDHVRVAGRLLARGGFSAADLVCGAHLPMHEPSAHALLRRGARPAPLHNNCSGKHAGLLLACRLFGFSSAGYEEPSHPLQKRILAKLADYSGVPASGIETAVDGCSLPVFLLPLSGLARAYARLTAVGRRRGELPAEFRARALIVRSMWESPAMVAGQGRFTTEFLEAGRGRWIGKEGAEGVYAVGLRPRNPREKAIGIAFKIEDGSSRGRDAVTLDVLARLGRLPASAQRRLAHHRRIALHNARGIEVGAIEAAVPLGGSGDRKVPRDEYSNKL